jgi:general secretion pathway protein K
MTGRPERADSYSGIFRSENGIALIMVLWILVLLSIVGLNYLSSSRWNVASTRNLKDETTSYYMALSGYNEAVNYLLADKDRNTDFADADGNFWTSEDTVPVTGKKAVSGGEVDIEIIDEDSKVNINTATPDRLKSLFSYAGIPDDEVQIIVDSLLDWKDSDSDVRLNGAEDDYYEGLSDPYEAKNMNFDLPEELALVRGVKPEYLYGAKDIKAVLPLITTFGSGNININTVSKEMMQAMGLDEGTIEAIMKQRSGESKGFRTVPPEFAALGFRATVTNNLRIEITAKANNSGIASKIVAVINRQYGVDGYKLQTLYWRESAENIRS